MDIWEIIKDRTRIEEVAEEIKGKLGVRWDKRGATMRALSENSFYININKQMYMRHKFDRGGSVIDLLVHETNMTLTEAGEYLAERLGIEFWQSDGEKAQASLKKAKQNVLDSIFGFFKRKLLGEAAIRPTYNGEPWTIDLIAEYHIRAKNSWAVEAIRYCAKRGWTLETVLLSGLGFWDGDRKGLYDWLTAAGIEPDHPAAIAVMGYKGDVQKWADKWGIKPRQNWLEKGQVWGMQENFLIYPHVERGRMKYFSGRCIDPNVEKKFGHYNPVGELMGERLPLWNFTYNHANEFVVVVEGQADAITLGQWGVAGVALAGAHGDATMIDRLANHHVFLALDGDETGQNSGEKLGYSLGGATQVVEWPQKDANDWLKAGGTADECKALLGKAPIFALWASQRLEKRRAAGGFVRPDEVKALNELIAQMPEFDFVRNRADLAKSMGIPQADLNRIIKATRETLTQKEADNPIEMRAATAKTLSFSYAENLPAGVRDALLTEALDHEGHAKCVLALHGNRAAYVPQWGWLTYNGKYWDLEGGQHLVERLVVETLKVRGHLAIEKGRDDLRKSTMCSRGNIVSIRDQLESHCIYAVADFDAYPDLLNCNNGIVNLQTGELMPHSPEYLFTYCVPVNYNPQADDNEWRAFLEQVVDGGDALDENFEQRKAEMMLYLQMAVGYSLTGRTSENCLFYLYGPTRSGKGTFVSTLMEVLGKPLSTGVEFSSMIADRNGDTQNFDLAGLAPARFITAAESGKHSRLNSEKLKQLTGEDEVRCAFKRRDHFTYKPKCKIWLQSNFPINIDVHDDAVWGRVHVIQFPNSYLGKEDKLLKQSLQRPEALEGVLAWAIQGAQWWYESRAYETKGLFVPALVKKATEEQRREQDFLQNFFDDCCELADPNRSDHVMPISELYQAFAQWSKETGVTQMRQRSFSISMRSKKFKDGRAYVDRNGKRQQVRVYWGLKLYPIAQRLGYSAGVNGQQPPLFDGMGE